jgi:acetyl/propionyl-CoA carboxylase alpha subunit
VAEKYLIRHAEDGDTALEIQREGDRVLVRREGEGETDWREVTLERVGDSGLYLLMMDNRPTELYLERRRGGAIVTIGRHAFDYDVMQWRPGLVARAGGVGGPSGVVKLTAPMTGSVVEVRCAVGQQVAAGDVVLVIESMKMNNELRAAAAGTIEAVPVTPGQRIKAGDLLVAIHVDAG